MTDRFPDSHISEDHSTVMMELVVTEETSSFYFVNSFCLIRLSIKTYTRDILGCNTINMLIKLISSPHFNTFSAYSN